jgi:hypothetical protein
MEENLDILKKIHNLVLKIQNKIKEYLKNKISNKEIENVSIEDIDSVLPKLAHIDIIRPIILVRAINVYFRNFRQYPRSH